MPLKKSLGNMYDWVTHCHSSLGGQCPHKCVYCYVQRNRFGVSPRYQGEPRLIGAELKVNYGSGRTIFIEHMNDMFADGIKDEYILAIMTHCKQYPDNTYVFQTKSPAMAYYFLSEFPNKYMIGTTIESNRGDIDEEGNPHLISQAPNRGLRFAGIQSFREAGIETFITIEPVMDFDTSEFVKMIVNAKPDFINIGADSKRCNLPEPSAQKLKDFMQALQDAGVTIRKKSNLERLLKQPEGVKK